MQKLFKISLCTFLIFCAAHTSSAKEFVLSEVTYHKGIYKYQNREISGEIIDYYENDQLKFRYTVISGRLHGEALEFYPNGKVKAKRNYVFGKLFGKYTIYFKDGTTQLEMTVDQNRYGHGEMVKNIAIAKKPGKKLKGDMEGHIVFYNESGQPLKSSENLPIEQQFNFKVFQEDEALYSNEKSK